MSLPIEFTPDHIDANSPQEAHLFRGFLRSGEPFKSLIANNPWLQPPDLKQPLGWGEGQYWDTTVARKHNLLERQKPANSDKRHPPNAARL